MEELKSIFALAGEIHGIPSGDWRTVSTLREACSINTYVHCTLIEISSKKGTPLLIIA